MRTITVRDVMTRTVVAVRPDTPFKEIARLMHEHRVSGVPVADQDGRIVGIVTEADLLRGERKERHASPFLQWIMEPRSSVELHRLQDLRAGDIMTRNVVTVGPDTPIQRAIDLILHAQVKRLPVTDETGRVLGIVSRRDLLQPFLRPDEDIRSEITDDVVFRTMWIDPDTVSVEVRRGVVALRGQVDRRSVKEILVEMVRRVDGVVGVE
ncbi:MAG TPA: CBS domain-containing protein, partial [Actinomycetota bacterium]|nr:CBS domain-containing protein [Actinomycetota bacterium]